MNNFSTSHGFWVIGIIFVVTFLLRAAPYILIREPKPGTSYDRVLSGLRQAMPLGILLVLVVYTLRDVQWSTTAAWPAIGGVVVTAVVHLWRSHAMLTMVAGIATFALLGLLIG